MVIETNHAPKMLETLKVRQKQVNAGGERQRFFYLYVSHPLFGRKGLKKLVDKGHVEVQTVGKGNCFARLKGE